MAPAGLLPSLLAGVGREDRGVSPRPRGNVVRVVLLLAAFALGTLGLRAADEPKPITAAEAVKSVGKPKVVVEMVVKKAKDRLEKRGIVFLDSEDDFKDEKNLGVAVSAEAAAKFK